VTDTVDPLGGSYFVESLTNQVEEGARTYFRSIEDQGGVLPCIESGFFVREIAEAAYRYQQELDRKERTVVGINEYVADEALDIPLLRVDEEAERWHLQRLNQMRRERDNREVRQRLVELKQAARGDENLMPYLTEAVRAYATLGETMGVLREVFGEYQPAWGY
ncbi:MAG: methylmalonyl-CoA mutase family protein, partial [Dehalococcoidia bacterium]